MHQPRIRMAALVAGAVLALGLTGCSDEDGTIVTDDGTVSLDGDEDGGRLTIDSSDGSVTLSAESDGQLPEDWPSQVVLPDGGSINSSASFASDEGEAWQVSVGYEGTAPADLIEHMTTELRNSGFTVTGEATAAGQTVASFVGDGLNVTASAGADDDRGNSVLLVVIAPEP